MEAELGRMYSGGVSRLLGLSVVSILEEAVAEQKNLQGNVKRLEEIFVPENMAKLNAVAPLLAFLAFDPQVDTAIADYVVSGTLPDDSGPDILVLLTLDSPAPVPVPVVRESFFQESFVQVTAGANTAHALVRTLFSEGTPAPPLPGIVFFSGFEETKAAYLPLATQRNGEDVRTELRRIFSVAAGAVDRDEREANIGKLTFALARQKIEFVHTGRTTFGEWMLRAYRMVLRNKGDIIGIIGLFG